MTEKYYARVSKEQTYWLVKNGERKAMPNMDAVYGAGLLPVKTLTKEELDSIPIAGKVDRKVDTSMGLMDKRAIVKVSNYSESDEPFLTFVTRHTPDRKELLEEQLETLRSQTDQDFEHVIIIDEYHRGIEWSSKEIRYHKDKISGKYVMILDDDDLLLSEIVVETLKGIVEKESPDVIVYKGDHRAVGLGILPSDRVWEKKEPIGGQIGSFSVTVESELWKRNIHNFTPKYSGDFDFIESLWKEVISVYWLDELLVGCNERE